MNPESKQALRNNLEALRNVRILKGKELKGFERDFDMIKKRKERVEIEMNGIDRKIDKIQEDINA